MENQNLPEQPGQEPGSGFTAKKVETPMLDSSTREQVTHEPVSSGGGLKSFYRENKFYVWGITLGILIIATLAFFAFRKPGTTKVPEAKIGLSVVDTPENVPTGSEVVYHIKIENNDSRKLTNLTLELAYPDGVTFLDTNVPKKDRLTLSGTQFKLPDLVPGINTALIVKAKTAGSVNDEKKLQMNLRYSFDNSSLEFVKAADFTIRLVASNINMEITGPSSTNNAQIVIYDLKYQNKSNDDVKNARIKFSYPQGFTFVSGNPKPTLDNTTWDISVLPAGQEGTIEIQGTYKGAGSGESKTITAELQALGSNGQYVKQGEATFTTAIANLPLVVGQDVENESDGIVKPGDTLTFNVHYLNTANTVASGVNVIVTLNSKALDLSTLRSEGGQVSGNTIQWNASTISAMENVSPNESGNLSFTVDVKNPATKDSSKNLTVVSSVKIKSNEYEAYFPGNDTTLKISSPAQVSSNLKFSNGSLPPKVGTASTYNVTLSLTNSTNDFSDGIVTAFIPLGAGGYVQGSVTGSEAGNVEYDPTTNKLTWKVGALPAHTGQFSAAKSLTFQVRINPSASQVNQAPTLVRNIQFVGKDTFTSEDIKLTTDDVTTADIGDYTNGQVTQ